MTLAVHDLRATLDREAPLYVPSNDAAAEWPEPDLAILSSHREAAPPLPIEVFGEVWWQWIEAAAESKGGPADYVATALLSCTGGLIANHRRAQVWPGWIEAPIVWTGNVGNPSTNKTPTLTAVLEPVRRLEEELDGDYADRRREWKTAVLAAELAEAAWQKECGEAHKKGYPLPGMPAAAEAPDAPQPRRLIVNDATVEKLIRLSAGNERGLTYVRDELAGWMGLMDRYGGSGSDRALWLEAFNGQPYRMDRVKDGDRPITTPALSVSLCGGIQPDRLASTVLAGDDDGLASRFLYVWPEQRRPTRPRSSCDTNGALIRLRRLASLPPMDTPLPCEPAAVDALHRWREVVADMEADAAGLFLSWIGKLSGYAVRIALVLEHLRWCAGPLETAPPRAVSATCMNDAIRFLRRFAVPMARRCFGDAALPEAERDAIALARWIMAQDQLPAALNARELRHRSALSTREPERYVAALNELTDAGWVRPAPTRDGERAGRQRKDWAVNPSLSAKHGMSVSSISSVSGHRRAIGANGANGTRVERPKGGDA